MRHEDLGKFFEEAFDKIEPQNEAHREKLAKMRERFKEINAETAREIQEVREEQARFRERYRGDKSLVEDAKKSSQELWDALLDGCDEQSALVDRITKATEKNRSSR